MRCSEPGHRALVAIHASAGMRALTAAVKRMRVPRYVGAVLGAGTAFWLCPFFLALLPTLRIRK